METSFKTKACKIQVGLRNNFHLTGWDLGSPCVQAYHVFENELRKSACLNSFSKRWEGFVICLSCQLNYLQEIKQNSSNSAQTYNKSDKKQSFLKSTLEGHTDCLLTKLEDSAGADFRIKPTCIILTLIQIFVYKLLFTIVFFGKMKKTSRNLSHSFHILKTKAPFEKELHSENKSTF